MKVLIVNTFSIQSTFSSFNTADVLIKNPAAALSDFLFIPLSYRLPAPLPPVRKNR